MVNLFLRGPKELPTTPAGDVAQLFVSARTTVLAQKRRAMQAKLNSPSPLPTKSPVEVRLALCLGGSGVGFLAELGRLG